VTRGQGRKSTIGIGIELDENEIPNLDAARIAGVDQRTIGIALGRKVDVELGAWSAGTGVAHHPKIVCLVSVNDVNERIQARAGEKTRPMFMGFHVELGRFVRPGR
jgi:hypothetical protein